MIEWNKNDEQTTGNTDASGLGWGPGFWPSICKVEVCEQSVTLHRLQQTVNSDGDVATWQYVGWDGRQRVVLMIHND
jgi:hypothetical protein